MPFPLGEDVGEAQASVVQLVKLSFTYAIILPCVLFFSGVFSRTHPPPCTNVTLVHVEFGQCRQGSLSTLLDSWPIQFDFLRLFVCLQLPATRGTQ